MIVSHSPSDALPVVLEQRQEAEVRQGCRVIAGYRINRDHRVIQRDRGIEQCRGCEPVTGRPDLRVTQVHLVMELGGRLRRGRCIGQHMVVGDQDLRRDQEAGTEPSSRRQRDPRHRAGGDRAAFEIVDRLQLIAANDALEDRVRLARLAKTFTQKVPPRLQDVGRRDLGRRLIAQRDCEPDQFSENGGIERRADAIGLPVAGNRAHDRSPG